MRGVGNWAVGVRKPVPGAPPGTQLGEGEIEVKSYPLDSAMRRHRILRLPIIRGVVALGSSLAIGFKALEISANAQLVEEPAGDAATDGGRRTATARSRTATAPSRTATAWPCRATARRRPATARAARQRREPHSNGASRRPRCRQREGARRDPPRGVVRHDRGRARAGDRAVLRRARRPHQPDQGPARARPCCSGWSRGCIRTALFLGYMFLLSRVKDLRRVFEYHGAEHKTISCFEAGLPLTARQRPALLAAAPALRHELPAGGDDRGDLRVRADRAARLVLAGADPHRRRAPDRRHLLRADQVRRAQPQPALGAGR